MDIITVLILISVVCKCIVFDKHQIAWYKALIPGYNKYVIGKSINAKKLGLINAIVIPLAKIYVFVCYAFEIWIIQTYAVEVKVPITDTQVATQVQVLVPKKIADIAIMSKYILIVLIGIALILWSIMMFKFTRQHKKSGWLVLLWAFIPAIPFFYFTITNTVFIDGEIKTMKKVITYE